MRQLSALLCAAGALIAAAALPAAGSGAVACPLAGQPGGPQYTCAPLPMPTPVSPPGPGPQPAPAPSALTHPAVRPAVGHRHTTFHLSLTSRVALGRSGVFVRSYRLEARTRGHAGCAADGGATLASGSAGQVLRVDLAPPAGAFWCAGRFQGAVTLSAGPYCPRGPLTAVAIPCPEFASRIQTVGHFSFRVR